MKNKCFNVDKLFGYLIIKVRKFLLIYENNIFGINLDSEVIIGVERGKGIGSENEWKFRRLCDIIV